MQNIFEGFFVEINLRKKSGFFPAHIIQIKKIVNHVKNISTELDQFSATYDNLILICDLNVEPEEENMLDFIKLKNLIKQKTCSKNPGNPSGIEVSKTLTFLTDFHKMTVSVLKSHFSKQKPTNIVSYRIYESFRNNSFRNELCDLCNIEYRHFLNIFWIFWINMLLSKKIVSEQMKVTL